MEKLDLKNVEHLHTTDVLKATRLEVLRYASMLALRLGGVSVEAERLSHYLYRRQRPVEHGPLLSLVVVIV